MNTKVKHRAMGQKGRKLLTDTQTETEPANHKPRDRLTGLKNVSKLVCMFSLLHQSLVN